MALHGDRLAQLRRERGITQAELARMLDVRQNQISGYENGRFKPSTETLITLIKILDTTADYLLGLSNKRHPDAEPEPDLTDLEAEMLSLMRQYDDASQARLIQLVQLAGGLHRRNDS